MLRRLLLSGAYPAAATLLERVFPGLARNQWLRFQLKRHHFLHVASAAAAASSPEDRALQLDAALGAISAPCTLHRARPEGSGSPAAPPPPHLPPPPLCGCRPGQARAGAAGAAGRV